MPDHLVSNKTFCIVTAIAFMIGVFLGRFSDNNISQKMENKSIVESKIESSNLQINANNTTQIQKDIKTITFDKHYDKKGALRRVIITKQQSNTQKVDNKTLAHQQIQQSQTKKEDNTQTITQYKSSWLVGASVPLNFNQMPKSVDLTVGYRIISDIYITSTFKDFKTLFLGVQLVL